MDSRRSSDGDSPLWDYPESVDEYEERMSEYSQDKDVAEAEDGQQQATTSDATLELMGGTVPENYMAGDREVTAGWIGNALDYPTGQSDQENGATTTPQSTCSQLCVADPDRSGCAEPGSNLDQYLLLVLLDAFDQPLATAAESSGFPDMEISDQEFEDMVDQFYPPVDQEESSPLTTRQIPTQSAEAVTGDFRAVPTEDAAPTRSSTRQSLSSIPESSCEDRVPGVIYFGSAATDIPTSASDGRSEQSHPRVTQTTLIQATPDSSMTRLSAQLERTTLVDPINRNPQDAENSLTTSPGKRRHSIETPQDKSLEYYAIIAETDSSSANSTPVSIRSSDQSASADIQDSQPERATAPRDIAEFVDTVLGHLFELERPVSPFEAPSIFHREGMYDRQEIELDEESGRLDISKIIRPETLARLRALQDKQAPLPPQPARADSSEEKKEETIMDIRRNIEFLSRDLPPMSAPFNDLEVPKKKNKKRKKPADDAEDFTLDPDTFEALFKKNLREIEDGSFCEADCQKGKGPWPPEPPTPTWTVSGNGKPIWK